MITNNILHFPLAAACGAPRHDYYFRNNAAAADSIMEMIRYGKAEGMAALLKREYPDVNVKNIIVNVIAGRLYVVDGNRHCIALVALDPDITIEKLNVLHPGVVRIWEAGVEEGKNSAENPYDVYIPMDVDASRISNARCGVDYFKNPPAPTRIIPSNFPYDSELLNEIDRGYPLYKTVQTVVTK